MEKELFEHSCLSLSLYFQAQTHLSLFFFPFSPAICLVLQHQSYGNHEINVFSVNILSADITDSNDSNIRNVHKFNSSLLFPLCVFLCQGASAKQMGTAAALPRLFHDSIPNNKFLVNAKLNTFKLFNRSPHTLLGIILQ